MKVLVVDDNASDLQRLQSIISAKGHQTISATNGEQAVAVAKSNQPDVIFMDVNMPGIDGFAATRTLKSDDVTKNTPVVLVTSKDQKADKAWGQMLGAKAYITKPYTDDQVLEQLNAI